MEKRYTPKQISTLLALLNTAASVTLILLNVYWVESERAWYLAFSGLAAFLSSFLLTFFSLNHFILQRIQPIYSAINSFRNPKDELFSSVDNKDVLAEINNEVMEWAKKKAYEIDVLRRTEKFRKDFIGDVFHELKTPAFNIQGYLLTLLDGGMDDPEVKQVYLERAAKNIDRLINTIKDVDMISQLEAGVLKLSFERFDIVDLVFEVLDLQEMRAQKYQIRIEFTLEQEDPIWVNADRKRIFEALNNLVVNSLKYGNPGGVSKILLQQEGDKVWVKVRDNGIGIDPNHQKHVFERFYRVDKSRSRERGGSGLGLAIVKHVVEAHQQRLYLKSELGVGTELGFSLSKAP